jgi:hypothetical protein
MQEDRKPINGYDEAIWRLVQLAYQGVSGPCYDVAVKLVADIYWRTDDAVRDLVARRMAENGDRIAEVVRMAVKRRKAA